MAASASYVLQPIWDLLRNSRDKIEELEERLNDVNLQDHLLSQLEIKKEEAAHRNTRQVALKEPLNNVFRYLVIRFLVKDLSASASDASLHLAATASSCSHT